MQNDIHKTPSEARVRREASRDYSRRKSNKSSSRSRGGSRHGGTVSTRNNKPTNPYADNDTKKTDENLQLNVVVAVDYIISEMHADKSTDPTAGIENYIGTLIFMVNEIFNHESLEKHINIHLMAIKKFTKKETNAMIFEDNPGETLDHVCKFLREDEKTLYNLDRNKNGTLDKKDISIFLTRRRFGPAGKKITHL